MTRAIALREVTGDDREFLYDVYASTRTDVADAPWDEAQRAGFLRHQFNAQRSDYEARFPDATHSIIIADGTAVGRIWVDRRPEEIRLLDIAVLPEYRNHGIGAELVGRLITESRTAGVPLRHSVYKDNVEALRLYERLGFEVVEDFGMYVLMEWVE